MPHCRKQDTPLKVPVQKAGIVKSVALQPQCRRTVLGTVHQSAAKLAVRDFVARINFNSTLTLTQLPTATKNATRVRDRYVATTQRFFLSVYGLLVKDHY